MSPSDKNEALSKILGIVKRPTAPDEAEIARRITAASAGIRESMTTHGVETQEQINSLLIDHIAGLQVTLEYAIEMIAYMESRRGFM